MGSYPAELVGDPEAGWWAVPTLPTWEHNPRLLPEGLPSERKHLVQRRPQFIHGQADHIRDRPVNPRDVLAGLPLCAVCAGLVHGSPVAM